jgi:hypothetical protein
MAINIVPPAEAARIVMEDIKRRPEGLSVLQSTAMTGSDFYVGNRLLHDVYRTLMEGVLYQLHESLDSKVLLPLGLGLVVVDLEDVPCDAVMIDHLGRLARDYRYSRLQ